MSDFVPLNDFGKDCQFPHKSSSKVCGCGTTADGGGSGGGTGGGGNNSGLDPTNPDMPSVETLGVTGHVSGVARNDNGAIPAMTVGSLTTVLVPAGKGYIVHPITGIKDVKWEAAEVPVPGIITTWMSTIVVNESGTISAVGGNIDPLMCRTHIILGTVTHINGAIMSVQNTPSVFGTVPYTAYDMAMMNRNKAITGGEVSPSAATPLGLAISAGILFFFNGTPSNPLNPNYIYTPSYGSMVMYPATGNGNVEPSTVAIPVTKYNPNGGAVIEDIPVPEENPEEDETSTIFRVFRLGSAFILMYGQTLYPDLATAAASVGSEPMVYPYKLENATLLASVAVRRTAEDLSDPTQAIVIAPGQSVGGGEDNGPGGSPLVVRFITETTVVEPGEKNLLLVSTADEPIEVIFKQYPEDVSPEDAPEETPPELPKFSAGDTVSVLQFGNGDVTLKVEDDLAEITPPLFFLPQPRGKGCVVTALCLYPETNSWTLAGDAAPGPDIPAGGGGGSGGGDEDVPGIVWAILPMTSNWSAPLPYSTPQAGLDPFGVVHLSGCLRPSATGAGLDTAFILPPECRPRASYPSFNATVAEAPYGTRMFIIEPNGELKFRQMEAGETYSLESISFAAN